MSKANNLAVNFPPAFLERMRTLLGEEFPAFEAILQEAPTTGLRLNTLKISPHEFEKITPFSLPPIPWCQPGFYIDTQQKPGKHPYQAAGLYYLQDPSAMAVTLVLDPQPGERILDLAAAPGGKATHIATLLENQGLLVANDIHTQRAWELAQNLERWGAHNVVITNETPERLAEVFNGFFDKVLVDAPCSGEGMFRKSGQARRDWSIETVQSCATRQISILEQSSCLVRPGGNLVYSTCTFSPPENEGVVSAFLRQNPEFELVQSHVVPGASPGRPEWLAGQATSPHLAWTLRLWPHHGMAEGHFIAKFQRAGNGRIKQPKVRIIQPLTSQAEQLYQAFVEHNLNLHDMPLKPELYGSYLYQVPASCPDLHGLRWLHPGWWLGTLKKNRFQPSHALVLGLHREHIHQVIDLGPEDAHLHAYLRGELVPGGFKHGWVALLVDGYPIGWGKSSHGTVKNFYPKGLRWL